MGRTLLFSLSATNGQQRPMRQLFWWRQHPGLASTRVTRVNAIILSAKDGTTSRFALSS